MFAFFKKIIYRIFWVFSEFDSWGWAYNIFEAKLALKNIKVLRNDWAYNYYTNFPKKIHKKSATKSSIFLNLFFDISLFFLFDQKTTETR